jgi:hypothetical protein
VTARYHPVVSEEAQPTTTLFRARVAGVRPAWKGLGAFLLYQAIACVIWLPPIGAAIGSRYVGAGWADARLYQWALAWTPWALRHGESPLFAPNIFVPDGANLTWVTTVPSLGIVSYPLQRVLGSLVTLNLLMLVAPALAAWATYLVCFGLTKRFWPSVIGGFFLGFSTYMAGHMTDHLNLVFIFPVPLAVYLVIRRVEGSLGRTWFVALLTLDLVFLFGSTTEVFATSAVFGTVAFALALAFGPRRGKLLETGLYIGLAYLLCAALMWPYLRSALDNAPSAALRPTDRTVIDLASWVTPREHTWLGGGDYPDITKRFTASAQEDAGYVGIAALVMVAGFAITEWRRRSTWALLAFLLIVATLSAGATLLILGRASMTMPGRWLADVPLLRHATAQRFPVYAALGLGVIAALWLARARGRWAWVRWVVVVTAAVMVIPVAEPAASHAAGAAPRFFTSGEVQQQIRQGETVLAITERPGTELAWMAASDFWYQVPQGYIGPIPAAYEGQPLYRGLAVNQLNPYIPTPAMFAEWLDARGATTVLLDDDAAWKFEPLLRSVGLEADYDGDGVTVWRPGPRGYVANDPWQVVVMGDAEHPGGVLRRFSLPALGDGDRIEGPDGRPTLFTFVGPGCASCAEHLQTVDAFAKQHPELRVIAVSSWDPAGTNTGLLRSLDLQHAEVGVDPLGRTATAMYGDVQPVLTPPTPYSVLMAGDGTILGRVDGVWTDQAASTLELP